MEMETRNPDYARCVLCDVLARLALSADEQIRVSVPGCPVCDLQIDFKTAIEETYSSCFDDELTDDQRKLVDEMDALMTLMSSRRAPHTLDQPEWEALRQKSAQALQAFGWEAAVVQPFVETEPGLWKRPYACGGGGQTIVTG